MLPAMALIRVHDSHLPVKFIGPGPKFLSTIFEKERLMERKDSQKDEGLDSGDGCKPL